jgi:hypothetical protein
MFSFKEWKNPCLQNLANEKFEKRRYLIEIDIDFTCVFHYSKKCFNTYCKYRDFKKFSHKLKNVFHAISFTTQIFRNSNKIVNEYQSRGFVK